MTRAQAVGCLALITALLSSCAGGSSPRFGGVEDELQPGYEESVEEQRWVEPDEPSQWEIDQAMEEADQRVREELGLGGWSCRLSVTFNDDWHDDVLCNNGTERHRPYLREWDDFVEEWELMESAADYEANLNAND